MATTSTVGTDNVMLSKEEVVPLTSSSPPSIPSDKTSAEKLKEGSRQSNRRNSTESRKKTKSKSNISNKSNNNNNKRKTDNISSCDAIESEIGNSSHSSLTERILPNRPAVDIARDTKRILEICYGGKSGSETSSVVVDNEVLTKLLPTEEGVDDGAVKTEKKKKKKPAAKNGKKKRRRRSESSANNQTESKLEDDEEAGGVTEKEDHPERATKSGSTKPKSRKKKKKTKTTDDDSIVTRDAAGKIVRKRRKIKGRHRVVKKELMKKGKDAKMELPIISESNDEGDIDYESMNDYDEEMYALNISSSTEDDENDHGEPDFGETVDDSSGDKDIEAQITSGDENEGDEGGDNRGENDVTSDVAIPLAIEQRPVTSLDTNTIPNVANNIDSIEVIEEQDIVRIIVDVTPATAGINIEANAADTAGSLSSVDSTACTSTAEEENRRRRKPVPLFGSYKNMVGVGLLFVLVVAALTILVLYFVSFKPTNKDNPIVAPSPAPTDASHSGVHPSPRPSIPLTSVPTSSPTTIFSTSSTSCQRPEQNSGVQIQEAEYAPEHFGNATIAAVKNGFCGKGYVTNLTSSGAGFEFLPFEVNATGYYRVAVRYNNADETEKSVQLQINTLGEGEFDLIPTGNESTWMVQSINNILLRQGKHVMRLYVQSDDQNAPSIDWLSLSFQESVSRFDYLLDLVDLYANITMLSESQLLALEWMSSRDLIDWSTLTDEEIIERYTLVQVYFSTSGDFWSKNNQWLSEFHACSWYGIACSKDNLVTDLMLDYNGLVGTIPSDVFLLTNLILISLDTNSLEGTIPTQMGQLDNLSKLFMQANFLTGSLPSEFGSLTNMRTLDLRANELNGPIREEMYSMHGLESLALSSNNLGGTLSTNIGQLTSMVHLDLQSDQLSGTIPSELGQLTLLSSLILGYNNISGSVPSELGLLTDLSILDINSNQLTGILPPELTVAQDVIIDSYGNNIIL